MWGVLIGYISSRTNNLMTGKFVLCLSDNCCFYERWVPGRSKTYVTFDITEESCKWSLTASNVCNYWHFQSLVKSKCIALILTLTIMSTVTYCKESRTWLVKHHTRTIYSYNILVLFSNLLPSSPVVAKISSLLATLLYEYQKLRDHVPLFLHDKNVIT